MYDYVVYILYYILAKIYPTRDIRMTYNYEKMKCFTY